MPSHPECLLCLVTNRHRLVQACGGEGDSWRRLLRRQIDGAVRAGVDIVHVRERDLPDRDLIGVVRESVAIARGSRTLVLVNDRADIALAGAASGVHLREDSPPAALVRTLGPSAWRLARSVHSVARAQRSGPIDFLVAGTVFNTPSKADTTERLGIEGLAAIVRAAGRIPVLAIGGIDEATAGAAARAGAAGIASIGAFLPRERGEDPAESVQRRAALLRRAFDT